MLVWADCHVSFLQSSPSETVGVFSVTLNLQLDQTGLSGADSDALQLDPNPSGQISGRGFLLLKFNRGAGPGADGVF